MRAHLPERSPHQSAGNHPDSIPGKGWQWGDGQGSERAERKRQHVRARRVITVRAAGVWGARFQADATLGQKSRFACRCLPTPSSTLSKSCSGGWRGTRVWLRAARRCVCRAHWSGCSFLTLGPPSTTHQLPLTFGLGQGYRDFGLMIQ
ncbi:hypothetical protein GGTG_02015 [Gaeumannomyces tritici R3-111a-1]|uniref:Uncharacterized protein n=1 Tax=Gaeumannomyces tritici (strain R3-111a-1) TaxID=644352 RepID=J3NL74_GAET3|nr:hypothetical protein GGTG_02015 [Gaeumannomyces tritici R3-111a-1]EJT82041.1 hypothetical protein GGTG_02015 [Gaeumannomyces tritici R3-111a-1]